VDVAMRGFLAEDFFRRAFPKWDGAWMGGYPPSPWISGIIELEENRKKIYRAQYFTGKILKTFGFRVRAASVIFPPLLSKS